MKYETLKQQKSEARIKIKIKFCGNFDFPKF